MHKMFKNVIYKNGWIYLPKELINLSEYKELVILPWMQESLLMLTIEEWDKLVEEMKGAGEAARVFQRIMSKAILLEVEEENSKENKIEFPEYFKMLLGIEGDEVVMAGSVYEKRGMRGIQIRKIRAEEE